VRSSPTPTASEDTKHLWHEIGMLYATAGEDGRKATMQGFVITCVAGALVLLSAPAFGTAWAGPLVAALVPVCAGLVFGGGFFGWRRYRFSKRRRILGWELSAVGEDATRPTVNGLGEYYDAQLILLRSQYEYLLSRYGTRAPRSTRLFEEAFGFTPEDAFEVGPLNVSPDTEAMRWLRERWESRLAARRASGEEFPALGLSEDRAYRVFPREMTVPMELATRSAYLSISLKVFRQRYGKGRVILSEDLLRRANRDFDEYRALVKR